MNLPCPCPLCQHDTGSSIDRLTGAEIRKLWKSRNREFSPEAWGPLTPETAVDLFRCANCGFTFFDPRFAGGEALYRELEDPTYYTGARPEFQRTIEFARKHHLHRVLDVGCGAGAFLDQARAAGLETVGLELNKTAAAVARAKGHPIFDVLLHEIDPAQAGSKFDLITLFQVVEHVTEPVAVMRAAAARLNLGGFISIAVPSEDGLLKYVRWDPHQWPPHHTSRWRKADFQQLAAAAGLEVVESGGDVLQGGDFAYWWKFHSELARCIGRKPLPGGNIAPNILSFIYRKTGMKYLMPHWGSSIYGYFRLPRR